MLYPVTFAFESVSLTLYNIPWIEGNTSGVLCMFANSATVLHNAALSSDMLLMSSTGSSGRTQDSFSWVNFLHRVHTDLFFLTMVLLSLVTYRVGRTYIENVGAVRKHDELEVICPLTVTWLSYLSVSAH